LTVETGAQPTFYYELGSPACYLLAERIMAGLPVVPEWEPVPVGAIRSEALAAERLEQLARLAGLQPVRWPRRWPPDTRQAMLAATFAKHIGRAVAFSLACFRQAFAGGRDLGEIDTVLIAAAACEIHPAALLKGIRMRSVQSALEQAGERAERAGVRVLPAIEVDGEIFAGEDAIERATDALAARVQG
jgi:2-hydroxychromene-2-carboxylate isomerase